MKLMLRQVERKESPIGINAETLSCRCPHCLHLRRVSVEEREAIINDYTQKVQLWYASSPLKAAFVRISDATVKRQVRG